MPGCPSPPQVSLLLACQILFVGYLLSAAPYADTLVMAVELLCHAGELALMVCVAVLLSRPGEQSNAVYFMVGEWGSPVAVRGLGQRPDVRDGTRRAALPSGAAPGPWLGEIPRS